MTENTATPNGDEEQTPQTQTPQSTGSDAHPDATAATDASSSQTAASDDATQPGSAQHSAGDTPPTPGTYTSNGYAPKPPAPGFFDWLRGLGLTREPGWLGGVSAGVAARIGIDVALVRGILVVLAIMGLPVIFAYGVAWLLLPDSAGKIHLEELIRGNPELPLVGIGLTLLIGLSAFGRGIWPAFTSFGASGVGFSIFGGFWASIWGLFILAGVILAVYFISRSVTNNRPPSGEATFVAPPQAPASYAMPNQPDAVPHFSENPQAAAAASSAADTAGWQAQQAQWKNEHAAWRAEQQQSQAEWRAAHRAQQQEARRIRMAEQRVQMEEYRARNPRVPGAVVVIVLGLALIAGAFARFMVDQHQELTGITVTSLILAVAMIVASLFGRRTSLLGFISGLGIVVVLIGSSFSAAGHILNIGTHELQASNAQSEAYSLPVGHVRVDLTDVTSHMASGSSRTELKVDQGIGQTRVYIPVDASVRIEASVGIGSINIHEHAAQNRNWVESSETDRTGRTLGGFNVHETLHLGNAEDATAFTVIVEVGIGSIVLIPIDETDRRNSDDRSSNENISDTSAGSAQSSVDQSEQAVREPQGALSW